MSTVTCSKPVFIISVIIISVALATAAGAIGYLVGLCRQKVSDTHDICKFRAQRILADAEYINQHLQFFDNLLTICCTSSIVRRFIETNATARGIAPFSQGVLISDTLYISGQLGMDSTGKLVPGGVEAETRQALKNIGAILKAAGGHYENVVKTTVLLANINDFGRVNNIYKEFFREPYPARAAYQVANLPLKGLVEIECVAVIGNITNRH